jgi:hypothetical protein
VKRAWVAPALRVYAFPNDFSKAQLIMPNVACRAAGKVDRSGKLYLVIESAGRTPNMSDLPRAEMPSVVPTARSGVSSADRAVIFPRASTHFYSPDLMHSVAASIFGVKTRFPRGNESDLTVPVPNYEGRLLQEPIRDVCEFRERRLRRWSF